MSARVSMKGASYVAFALMCLQPSPQYLVHGYTTSFAMTYNYADSMGVPKPSPSRYPLMNLKGHTPASLCLKQAVEGSAQTPGWCSRVKAWWRLRASWSHRRLPCSGECGTLYVCGIRYSSQRVNVFSVPLLCRCWCCLERVHRV